MYEVLCAYCITTFIISLGILVVAFCDLAVVVVANVALNRLGTVATSAAASSRSKTAEIY